MHLVAGLLLEFNEVEFVNAEAFPSSFRAKDPGGTVHVRLCIALLLLLHSCHVYYALHYHYCCMHAMYVSSTSRVQCICVHMQ